MSSNVTGRHDMIGWNHSPRWVGAQLLAIFAVALALRGGVALTSTHVPVADETSYDETGWAIATGQGYVLDGRFTFKPPLYSAFLGGVYAFCGHDYHAVRVVQAVLGASLCLLMVWFGWTLMGSREGLLAGWMTAVYPPFIVLTQWLLSENLFVWLTVISLLLFVRFLQAPRWWKGVLAGMACGLNALTRSVGIGLPMLFAVIMLTAQRGLWPAKRRFGYALLIAASCAVTILPWTLRNAVKLDAFVPISTVGGRALYTSWVDIPDGKRLGFGVIRSDVAARVARMGEVEADRFLYREALAHLQQHPVEGLKLLAIKVLFFWSPFDWEILGNGQGVYNGGFVFLVPFILLGLWSLGRYPPETRLLCLSVVGYYFLISVMYYGLPRYRLPVEPLLLLLASSGLLVFWLAGWRWGRRRAAFAGIWAAVNLSAAVSSVHVKWAARSVLEWMRIW